jgi:SdiA-regulated
VIGASAIAGWKLRLDEVSALCVRRAPSGDQELLAVGDENFAIHRATLQGDRLESRRRVSVRHALPDRHSIGGGGSEWESIAADGSGRVFVLRESTATVFVFSPGLRKLQHTIQLDLEASADVHARHLLDDPNAGPEGILLLKAGHLLVVKQRDPIVFIEFARTSERPNGLSGGSYLPSAESFAVSDGRRTTVRAVASWRLDSDTEAMVESANDLAVDDRSRLHAISSKSRTIFELAAADPAEATISIDFAWALPDELRAEGDSKAEGLTFDDQGRPLVALDVKDKAMNGFLLERLERGGE